ncbi:hypothetical protein FVEG_11130 [Fusarium verticillioides 7600]|uniref:Uncharacterized protein n=1 Tax=Gibberella moniliformis (strain M3125 / FGSC 7600) TaxID=334819 RepID=W7MX71_GIBM7|nr:hypothetical protein FVEG_11130 [Fusarium verticillioides 7600]EWG52360.1 hypothetical protein FVEG_11130 [Fusarium verticillioides 7600]
MVAFNTLLIFASSLVPLATGAALPTHEDSPSPGVKIKTSRGTTTTAKTGPLQGKASASSTSTLLPATAHGPAASTAKTTAPKSAPPEIGDVRCEIMNVMKEAVFASTYAIPGVGPVATAARTVAKEVLTVVSLGWEMFCPYMSLDLARDRGR